MMNPAERLLAAGLLVLLAALAPRVMEAQADPSRVQAEFQSPVITWADGRSWMFNSGSAIANGEPVLHTLYYGDVVLKAIGSGVTFQAGITLTKRFKSPETHRRWIRLWGQRATTAYWTSQRGIEATLELTTPPPSGSRSDPISVTYRLHGTFLTKVETFTTTSSAAPYGLRLRLLFAEIERVT